MKKNNKKAPELPEFDFVESKHDDLILQINPKFLQIDTSGILKSDRENVLKLIKRGYKGTEAAQIIVEAQYDPMIETLNEGLGSVSGEIKNPKNAQDTYESQETARLKSQILKVQSYVDNLKKHAEQVYADLNVNNFAEFENADGIESFFDENLAGDIYQKDKKMLATLLGQGKTSREAAQSVYNELYAQTERDINEEIKAANAQLSNYRRRVPSAQNQQLIEQKTNEIADLKNQKERLKFYRKEIELYATMFYKTTRKQDGRKPEKPTVQENTQQPTLEEDVQKPAANTHEIETEAQNFVDENTDKHSLTQGGPINMDAGKPKTKKTIEEQVNTTGENEAALVENPKEDDLNLQIDHNFLDLNTEKVLRSDGESLLKLIKRGFTGTEAAKLIAEAQYAPMIDTLNEGLECVQAFGSGEIKIPQDVQEAYKSQETARLNAQIEKVNNYTRNLTIYAQHLYADLNLENLADYSGSKNVETFFNDNLAGDIYQEDKQLLAELFNKGKTISEAVDGVYGASYMGAEQTLSEKIKEATADVHKLMRRPPSEKNQRLIDQKTKETVDLENQRERLRFYKNEIELYAKIFHKNMVSDRENIEFLKPTTKEENAKNLRDFMAFENKRNKAQQTKPAQPEIEEQSFEEEDEKDTYRYVFTQRELRTLAAAGLKKRKTIENYVNAIGGYDADFVETPKGYGMIKGALAMIHQAEDELDKEEEEARKEQEAFYEALHQVYAEKKPEDDDNEKS